MIFSFWRASLTGEIVGEILPRQKKGIKQINMTKQKCNYCNKSEGENTKVVVYQYAGKVQCSVCLSFLILHMYEQATEIIFNQIEKIQLLEEELKAKE